jgi:ketosteroid isomerase-like protein
MRRTPVDSAALSVTERLDRLEVRAAIEDLVTHYGMVIDNRDMEGVAQLFCEDGRFGHQDQPGVVGRDAIKVFYRERLSGQEYSYHFSHNQLVDYAGGDIATGVVNAHAEMGFQGEVLVAAMRYHDDYRRDGGLWRFARRRLSFFYLMPAADLWVGNFGELRKQWPAPAIAADIPQSLDTYREFIAAQ